jgi:hypothetical protein
VIAVCFLLSVLWLPINLFFWLAEDNDLNGLAALLNLLCIAACVLYEPKGDRK